MFYFKILICSGLIFLSILFYVWISKHFCTSDSCKNIAIAVTNKVDYV